MNVKPPHTLRLADYEEVHSRFYLLHVSRLQHQEMLAHSWVSFSVRFQERLHWEQLRKGDLVLIAPLLQNPLVVAAKVLTKIIRESLDSVGEPLLVLLKLLGSQRHRAFPTELFFTRSRLFPLARNTFRRHWEASTPDAESLPREPELGPLFTYGRYVIRLADSVADDQFIAGLATRHPFGNTDAFIRLLALSDNKPVAAILANYSSSSTHSHAASWRVFREDYVWVRDRSLFIRRILSFPRDWAPQVALLQALIALTPRLTDGAPSILEAVSYDYHPLAKRLGFRIEVPRRLQDSFYYWRPFPNGVLPVLPPAEPWRLQGPDIRTLLRQRSNTHYWLLRTREVNLEAARDKAAWALHASPQNSGHWRMVRPGHTVFFKTPDCRVVMYGTVEKTEKRAVRGLEHFPLWIDFQRPLSESFSVDILGHSKERWFKQLAGGGILRLPEEFGAAILAAAQLELREGKMWVEPNPFLLHRTQFDVIPRQVFVVQAFKLRHTIYPVIQEALAESGYTTRYSADRSGQVIFDDIWLMLNESEIILCDFTDMRPNVYLEYGMALVLGKPIVAITQRQQDIPSDTPNLKYLLYTDRLGDRSLRDHLPNALRDTLADHASTRVSPPIGPAASRS